MTVGEKIKKIRQLYGYTQAELASLSTLPLATIKQYESNRRTPKEFQLTQIANALGVSYEYLSDHNIESYNDVKHALLELEDTFGLKISEINGNCVLQFNDMELTQFLEEWLNAKKGSNSSTQTLKDYEIWKVTYPLCKNNVIEKEIECNGDIE